MESLERLHELGRGDIAYNWDDGSPPDKRGIMLLRGAKLFEVDAGTVTPRPQLSAERDMTGYAVDEPLGTGIIGVSPGVYYYVRFISADARGLTIEYSKASPELVARIGVSPPPFRGEAVTLANLIGRDEGPVLDLASGELVSVRQDANNAFLDRLGKGDIAFIQDDDYRKNDNEPHQGLGALRGATIRLLLGDRPTWLETFDAEGSAAVHRMPPLPARVRVTTAGGDDYDVHLIWADFNALHLTYQRAVERPASNQARFSAELEGGASVEVLGVTRFDAAEAERTGRLSWWKPDGSPTEAPGVLPADVEGSDPIVAFHIRPSSAEFSLRTVDRDRFVRPKAQWESPGERLEVWLAALDYPEDRRFGNLEFRVQAGEPETLWEIPLKDVERNSWLSIDRHGAVKAIVQETPAVQAFTVTISISAAGLEGDDFIFTDIEGGRHVARTIRGGEAQIWLQSTFPLDRAAGLSRVRRSWSTALFRNVSLASGQRAEVEIQIAPPDPPGGAAPEPTQTEPVVSDAGAVAAHYERAAMDRAGLEFKPPAYEGPPVTVTIAFFVKPDGTIDRPRVAESSGREDLDRAALEAVRLTGKLSPAPRSLAPELEPVEVSLVFRIGG